VSLKGFEVGDAPCSASGLPRDRGSAPGFPVRWCVLTYTYEGERIELFVTEYVIVRKRGEILIESPAGQLAGIWMLGERLATGRHQLEGRPRQAIEASL
jgi:hypothetical protein